jgi:hypothetical protein
MNWLNELPSPRCLIHDTLEEGEAAGPVRERREMLGGKGANQAVAAAGITVGHPGAGWS